MLRSYFGVLLGKEDLSYCFGEATTSFSFFNYMETQVDLDKSLVEEVLSHTKWNMPGSSYERFFCLDDRYFVIWDLSIAPNYEKKNLLESLYNQTLSKSGIIKYKDLNLDLSDLLLKVEQKWDNPPYYIIRKILSSKAYKKGLGFGVEVDTNGEIGWMDYRGFILGYLRNNLGKKYHPVTLLTHEDLQVRKIAKKYLIELGEEL